MVIVFLSVKFSSSVAWYSLLSKRDDSISLFSNKF